MSGNLIWHVARVATVLVLVALLLWLSYDPRSAAAATRQAWRWLRRR